MKNFQHLIVPERDPASVPTPAAGEVELYVDKTNKHLTQVDSAGAVIDLATTTDPTQVTSPDNTTYTESTDPQINFVVQGNAVGHVAIDADTGLPKWTLTGILDPAAFAGTPQTLAQRDALVATNPTVKAGYLVYVADGATKGYQWWDGTAWADIGAGAVSTQSQFIVRDDSTTGAAPTAAEWPNPQNTDRCIVVLSDDTLEFYEVQAGAWALLQSIAPGGSTSLVDAWRAVANTDYETQGVVSFKQIKDAIYEEYRMFNSGAWDANDSPTPLNQYVAGSSGVETTNFPNGLAAPQSFISEYYGSATDGVQRLTIFGTPAATRGVWSRIYQNGANWSTWQREGAVWEYTPGPTTTGDKYFVSDGWVVINDGDELKLNSTVFKTAVRVGVVSDWANVPAITISDAAAAAGWAIEGTQPTSGTQVIDLIPDTVYKKWLLRKVDLDSTSSDLTAKVDTILGVALNDGSLGDFLTAKTIPKNSTIKAAFQAIANAIEGQKITGQYIGSATTYASLPKTNTQTGDADNGDYAIQSKDDIGTGTAKNPQYPAGIYIFDGTNYNFSVPLIFSAVQLTDAQIQSRTDLNIGLVSGKQMYDREQATKGSSADFAANSAENTIGKSWDAYTLSLALDPLQFTDVAALLAFDTTNVRDKRDGYVKATKEAVYLDKSAVTGGDYTPTTGGGRWFKTAASSTTAVMGASGASHAGGLVPDPGATAGTTKFLREDATFAVPPTPANMTGATASVAGTVGLVPAPAAGDQAKYLAGDGTYKALPSTAPVSLHDFGLATRTQVTQTGTNAHLEGGAGYTLTATGLPDAFVCRFINTTASAQTVSLVGFTGAYVREGTTTTTLGATMTVPGHTIWDAYSDKNGPSVYLNVKPGGSSAQTTASTAISFNSDVSLQCNNTWTARSIGNIGDTTKDFAAPDGSNHYQAKRDMVIDVSVTAMSSEGGGLTVGCAFQLYRASTWVNCFATTSVNNPSAGVVPFHQTAQVAIKTGDYIRFQTNANDGGNNNYPGARVFRIGITEAPSLTLMPANSTVLTPRSITGSITSVGYDGVELPYTIPLGPGLVLDAITVTGGTVASSIQTANMGVIKIKPQGADVSVSHTTKVGATFNGPQTVSKQIGLSTNFTTTATNVNFGVTLQEGDEILILGDYGNDPNQSNTFYLPYVRAGAALRLTSWPAADHLLTMTFPATLTNTASVTHGGGNTGYRMRAFVVRRDGVNGYVIQTGTAVRTQVTVNIDGVAWGGPGFTGTSMRVSKTLAALKYIAIATADNGCTASIADPVTGAMELAIPTGTTGTVNITTTLGDLVTAQRRVASAPLASAQAGTAVTLGNFKFRYSANATNGNLDIATVTGTDTIDWTAQENYATGTAATGATNITVTTTYQTLNGGGLSRNESGGYLIKSATANYRVRLDNYADSRIYLDAERVDLGYGVVVPVGTEIFSPRNISGTGISATVGRDNTVRTIAITGIAAGSEISAPTATGGATVLLVDSGRGGTAYVDVIPAGADTAISYTTSVWRRSLSATVNGSAANVNGAASVNVDGTKSFQFWLALAAGQRLSAAPVVTNATLLSWSADGYGEISPNNAGNVTIAATSVAVSPVAKGLAQANAGVAVNIGTIRLMMPTGGNRSWQVQSNTGANLTLQIQNLWSDGGAGVGLVNMTATTGTWTYVNSGWNFTNLGQWQNMLVNDQTSGRWYNIRAEVGGSYNNCSYSWFEIV